MGYFVQAICTNMIGGVYAEDFLKQIKEPNIMEEATKYSVEFPSPCFLRGEFKKLKINLQFRNFSRLRERKDDFFIKKKEIHIPLSPAWTVYQTDRPL